MARSKYHVIRREKSGDPGATKRKGDHNLDVELIKAFDRKDNVQYRRKRICMTGSKIPAHTPGEFKVASGWIEVHLLSFLLSSHSTSKILFFCSLLPSPPSTCKAEWQRSICSYMSSLLKIPDHELIRMTGDYMICFSWTEMTKRNSKGFVIGHAVWCFITLAHRSLGADGNFPAYSVQTHCMPTTGEIKL